MDSKDIIKLIKEYNSHEDEIFNHCADLFIATIRKDLEETYNSGKWTSIINCNELGFVVSEIKNYFREFKIAPICYGYTSKHGESLVEDYQDDFMPFNEYLEKKEYINNEICGFQCEDILDMKPFCEALERKGFKCYIFDFKLVVVLEIE